MVGAGMPILISLPLANFFEAMENGKKMGRPPFFLLFPRKKKNPTSQGIHTVMEMGVMGASE